MVTRKATDLLTVNNRFKIWQRTLNIQKLTNRFVSRILHHHFSRRNQRLNICGLCIGYYGPHIFRNQWVSTSIYSWSRLVGRSTWNDDEISSWKRILSNIQSSLFWAAIKASIPSHGQKPKSDLRQKKFLLTAQTGVAKPNILPIKMVKVKRKFL